MEHSMILRELNQDSPLYQEALELRYRLFFQEHGLPRAILVDEHEESSVHLALVDGERLVAYGRLTHLGQDAARLSQILVRPEEQGKGYGRRILAALVRRAQADGAKEIHLNARTTATGLYRKQGFRANGAPFPSRSTGVPHLPMIYVPDPPG